MKLLLDEMFPPAAAEQLRERGHDVVAVIERDGLPGTEDRELFEIAQGEERALVTENVPDFIRLDRAWREAGREHYGIVFGSRPRGTHDRIVGWLVRTLDRFMEDRPGTEAASLVTWLPRAP